MANYDQRQKKIYFDCKQQQLQQQQQQHVQLQQLQQQQVEIGFFLGS